MTIGEPGGKLVVDASVAISIVRRERAANELAAVLRRHRAAGGRLLVPAVFWLEVVNVLTRRYGTSPAVILEAVAELDEIGLETVELDRPMLLLALDAVARSGLTAYDAAYLALAEASDGQLLSGDRSLATAAGTRAMPRGEDRGVREERARYEPDRPSWSTWPGAAAYLQELRAQWRAVSMGARVDLEDKEAVGAALERT